MKRLWQYGVDIIDHFRRHLISYHLPSPSLQEFFFFVFPQSWGLPVSTFSPPMVGANLALVQTDTLGPEKGMYLWEGVFFFVWMGSENISFESVEYLWQKRYRGIFRPPLVHHHRPDYWLTGGTYSRRRRKKGRSFHIERRRLCFMLHCHFSSYSPSPPFLLL